MFNDFKKFIFIFSLLFILLLSIGAISASEDLDNPMVDSVSELAIDEGLAAVNEVDADNEIISNEEIETEIEKSDEDNILSEETPSNTITVNGGTFGDIKAAIDYAKDGDTIELNGTFEGTGDRIDVLKSLSFKGNENTILDAKKLSGIFLTFSNSSFENLFLINSNDSAIKAYNNCSVLNCYFENNTNHDINEGGGAIYCSAGLNVMDCTFNNNFADNFGGAIYSSANLHIVNSRFDKNAVPESNAQYGGVIYCPENSSFINCNFTNSSDQIGKGCAIYSRGNCSFINCSFINNPAKFTGDYRLIYSEGICYIKSCRFINGANNIFSSKICSVEDSNFTDNNVQIESFNINGGVIASSGTLSVVNCIFKNNHLNSTWGHGGAIFSTRNCSVINCTFINNSASSGGGAISSFGRYSYVENCSFIDNIMALENIKIINGSSFENNTKTIYYDFDSVIRHFKSFYKKLGENIYGDDFFIIDCSFDNNKESAIGAFFYLGDDLSTTLRFNLSVINSSFKNNKAKSYGSVFYLDGSYIQKISSNINFINSTFSNNLVTGKPSGEYMHFSNGTISYWGPIDAKVNIINCSGLGKNDDMFKIKTTIFAQSVSMVYKGGKYLVVNFTGGQGFKLTIKLNGKTYTKTTNSKGQVKLFLGNLIPKNYTATVSFAGDNFYLKTSKSVKVVVKKATPKLTASAKTFRVKVKTKKYTITLKNHKNTVLKSYKLTLRVNGKTFSAKTNSKGKATFKITNLKKRGTFKAVIKYARNKYYKKLSKTVKITVKR